MRSKCLMVLLAATTMVGLQFASAQNTTAAQPDSAPQAVAAPSNPNPAGMTSGPAVNATMTAATPVMAVEAAPKSNKKSKAPQFTDPKDPNKSPWWEPRDWDWISKQIGG